ncbi:MAG: hypothetical protein U0174_05325 [Polyangiaceae bacterium]
MKRSVLAVCAAAAAFLSTTAFADVPPEPGRKRVPVRYIVQRIPKGSMRLWGVPCGADDHGASARAGTWFEVKEGEPHDVGRYSNGTCPVYAIKNDLFVSKLSAREESSPNWLDDARKASVPCQGMEGLFFQREISSSEPRNTDDSIFGVVSLSEAECKVAVSSAPVTSIDHTSSVPGKSRCGCGVQRAEDAIVPWFLALGALAVSRRRHQVAAKVTSRARGTRCSKS